MAILVPRRKFKGKYRACALVDVRAQVLRSFRGTRSTYRKRDLISTKSNLLLCSFVISIDIRLQRIAVRQNLIGALVAVKQANPDVDNVASRMWRFFHQKNGVPVPMKHIPRFLKSLMACVRA